MADVRVLVELSPEFAELKAMLDDAYVIEYETHAAGETPHWQVAAVCRSLSRAEQWLRDESKGKSWSDLAYLEGSGTSMRLITNFSDSDWTSFSIRKYKLV